MLHYVHLKRPMLVGGVRFTPEDCLGRIETDLPVRDLIAIVQFSGCDLVTEGQHESHDGDAEDDSPSGDFADYSDAVRESLVAAGVTTLAEAADYYRENDSFAPLKDIGKATNTRLIEQIEAAGLAKE